MGKIVQEFLNQKTDRFRKLQNCGYMTKHKKFVLESAKNVFDMLPSGCVANFSNIC